jgi:hypothetical protein
MEWGLIIVEELVDFVGPPSRVVAIKARELEAQRQSLEQTIPVVEVFVHLVTTIPQMKPSLVITVIPCISTTITAVIPTILTTQKGNNARVGHLWMLRGWPNLWVN